MKQVTWTITENTPLTPDTYRLRLTGDTEAITAPGQFVNLKLSGFYLRRPISVCDWEPGAATLIYKVLGHGTAAMTHLPAGTELDVLTGLGNGYDTSLAGERPLLILTSCQASREYLDYLEGLHISWIACGGDKIDLARACEILKEEFGVQRAAVVGGGHINAAFLADGLLDEVSILVGAGIDGRGGMAAVFDGLPMDRPVTPLKLTSVQQYGTGAVWLRYHTEK